MKKNYLVKGLLLAFLGVAALPATAITLDAPPIPTGKKVKVEKSAENKPQKAEKPQKVEKQQNIKKADAAEKVDKPKKTEKIDKPKKVEKSKKVKKVEQKNETVNPLYPSKYTASYIDGIKDEYKPVSKDEVIYVSLDILKGTNGDFSRNAILGNNLTQRPIKIEFKDLSTFNKNYADYDALGWKRGKSLYIYINQKHSTSPAIALAALLAHEAMHQDEYNSLAEETYAWTMEAAVFTELMQLYPDYEIPQDSLAQRELTLKKLFERGNFTNRYIKKTVLSNDGYQNLPSSSPGFEEL